MVNKNPTSIKGFGNLQLIKLVTVMLSLGSYQVKMVRFLLSDIGIMVLKVLPAYGISKTL